MNIPRVGIFCPLDTLSPAYSISEVIVEQARMLARQQIPTQVWTLEGHDPRRDPVANVLLADPEAARYVTILPVIPRLILYDYADITRPPDEQVTPYDYDTIPRFEDKVDALVEGMRGPVESVDVILAHDLLFQTHYLPHGLTCRILAGLYPDVRWLHWQHSGPKMQLPNPLPEWPHQSRFQPMPNSRFVYVNNSMFDRQLVALHRGILESDLAYVPNTRDVMDYFGFQPETKRFVQEHDLLSAELLIVVPANLREGKQPKKALMVTRAFRDCGRDARLVWVASYASPDQKEHADYIAGLKAFAAELGLPPEAFLITGEHCDAWKTFTPRPAVRDLQQIADLFVLPSLSEAHSLVAMEAALCRQTLILNADFQSMAEWFPRGASVSWHFGSLRVEDLHYHKPGDPEASPLECELTHYRARAYSLLHELDGNRAWLAFNHQKRFGNTNYVFHRYLAPLLYNDCPVTPVRKARSRALMAAVPSLSG